ncbi:ATP-binding protein [Lacihabitans sp. LS3-19]|uniref:ATP-binding protein n=1 Tax=Lacihabitans sp. LS3-19 TaxID=2487335 RepID=UPI0020CE95C3|nr:ATP-binding protein [Lacihabitans sp. LS3-19]MCP9770172.1 ATP-binding protein [Lacihabitans sp. LS3-19]
MIQRHILSSLKKLINKFPVIAVTGPRQSGKTTFLKESFPDYKYVSLEDPRVKAFFKKDPTGFLAEYGDKVIFDEAQGLPELFSYIQTIVDNSGKMGQFILSGSQNFHLMQNITQSLAGRVAIFKLFPFDFLELEKAGLLSENYEEALIKGFYPAIYNRNLSSTDFYNNYLQTYVERDITTLVNVRDLSKFRAFIRLCAARVGQLLNLNDIANGCGISQPTAKSWLSILETSYIVFQLTPYFQNFNKRIVKSPKIYFFDTGLLCHLLGIKKAQDLLLNPYKGSLFENLTIAQLYKESAHNAINNEYYFWRDSNGHEVDLLSIEGLKYHIFEIKSSKTILSEQFKGLDHFEEFAKDYVLSKTLIYGGKDNQKRTNYIIKPWNKPGL